MLHRADENDKLVSKDERKIKHTRLCMHTVHTTHTARNIHRLRHRRCTWMEEVRDWSGNANTIIMLTLNKCGVFIYIKNIAHLAHVHHLSCLFCGSLITTRYSGSSPLSLLLLFACPLTPVRVCVLRGGILIARILSGNQIKVLPQNIFAKNDNLEYL